MAEYAVTSHTGTIRSESSTRNDPSVVRFPSTLDELHNE